MADLQTLGRRQYVSVRGLAGVLKDIRDNGLPSAISRSAIKRARETEFSEYVTPYGAVIRSIQIGEDDKGMPCTFWYTDTRACLYMFIAECGKLEAFFLARLRVHPCDAEHPWRIIIYNDEISPGNQLLRHNNRKTQTFYYSFMEFGADALSSEFLWFTLTVARSDEVNEISGWSFGTFSNTLMKTFEVFASEGFTCGPVILWANIHLLVCDEAALKATLDVKGASGNLCCFKCRNVYSKKAYAAAANKQGIVSIANLDINKIDMHTDNTIIEVAKHLWDEKARLRPAAFNALQIRLGMNHNPNGIMLSHIHFAIRVITGSCFDPQHVYLVHGIFNIECGLLLDNLKTKAKIKANEINNFFQTFTWPAYSKVGKNMFKDRKEKEKGEAVTCSASEILGSFALLQEFLLLRVWATLNPMLKAACASFFALCFVLVMMLSVPRGGVTATMLLAAIMKHLKLHGVAYGRDHWKPKFHYALHIAQQLADLGLIVFCFTHERKHKEIKRYIQGRFDTTAHTYERNILQDVLHMQKLALHEDISYPYGTRLLSPRPPIDTSRLLAYYYPGCQEYYTSVDAKVHNHTSCHVNDVVCLKWSDDSIVYGQIMLLFSVDSVCKACVHVWTKMPQMNMYNVNGSDFFVELESIVDTCVYKIDNGVGFVVPPRGAVHAEHRND